MALGKLNDGRFSRFSWITQWRMVCLDTEWRVKGKKEGGGWEEARIHRAVLPAGRCVLSLSFLRDAVNKVMPFIPTEAKQESPYQDLYKYKIYILYVNIYLMIYFICI